MDVSSSVMTSGCTWTCRKQTLPSIIEAVSPVNKTMLPIVEPRLPLHQLGIVLTMHVESLQLVLNVKQVERGILATFHFFTLQRRPYSFNTAKPIAGVAMNRLERRTHSCRTSNLAWRRGTGRTGAPARRQHPLSRWSRQPQGGTDVELSN